MPNEEPIFKFNGLKRCLTTMGYQLEEAKPWIPITGQDVGIEEFRSGNVTFDPAGGVNLNVDGVKHIGFLYKRSYHLEEFGKPRMHLCKCRVIQDFINKGAFEVEYRFAETDEVMVIDMDDNDKDKKVSNLPVCKYCINQLQSPKYGLVRGSRDFAQLVGQVNKANLAKQEQEDKEKDIFGYTKNWEKISREYREKKGYVCERCGVRITNPFDYHFMHVHHKNGKKANNKEANLQCLCIDCHSKVDNTHKERWTKGSNKIILNEYIKRYKNNVF